MRFRPVAIGAAVAAAGIALTVGVAQCTAPRYVKPTLELPPAKKGELSQAELKIEAAIQQCVDLQVARDYFDRFFRTAYLVIDGYDSLCFTYAREGDGAALHRGLPDGAKPDLIIHLNEANCYNLPKIFEDGEISDEEQYRIFRVTLLPSIRSELQSDVLYDPVLSKFLNLPDFIQLTLTNKEKCLYQNTTQELTLTIINIDGQWLAFEGAMGDPDVRMAFSHKQAAHFRELTFGLAGQTDKGGRKKKLAEVVKFLDAVTVYRRG